MILTGEIVPIDWFRALLLGLLQGLTEFLPVSSTAHMAIAPQLLGMPDPGAAFSAIVQLGPIAAIIFYFRNDLSRYIHGILRTKSPRNVAPDDTDARLGWYTLFASIPGLVFGALLEPKIDKEFRDLHLIAASLIVLAIILWWAERVGRRVVSLEKMSFQQSQIIGWAQVLSLVPGTSRSGVTITAGLFLGLTRESAARFSFLLGIPFITAAGLYKLAKLFLETRKEHSFAALFSTIGPYLFAAFVAGAFAYIVVRWFLGFMKKHNTNIFILYRILLGIALLVLLHYHLIKQPKKETAPNPASTTSQALSAHPSLVGDIHAGKAVRL